MEQMTTGRCPKCGRELNIPAELEDFSCMYCGARLTQADLCPQEEQALSADEQAESFAHATSRLGWCVTNFHGYQQKILPGV